MKIKNQDLPGKLVDPEAAHLDNTITKRIMEGNMKKQIENLIFKFNQAWTQGKLEDVMPLLHPDAIFIAPDLKTEIAGKAACLQTLKEFVKNAKTKSFNIVDTKIHIWQNTAVASVDYHIEYDMNNKTYKEAGKEFWTMSNQGGEWLLVWRVMAANENVE